MTQLTEKKHWSREPYVWMIIAFPASAVIAGIITIYIAIQTEDGLVVDDYYKRGLEINRTLDRDKRAQDYRLSADVKYPVYGDKLLINIASASDYKIPESINVNLLHATRKGFDQSFTVQITDDGNYLVPADKMQAGRWHVLIEHDDWRLLQTLRVYPAS